MMAQDIFHEMIVPLPLGQIRGGGFWFPAPSSTTAESVDSLFYFILIISLIFFAIILGTMTFFVLRYRRGAGRPLIRDRSRCRHL